MGPTEREVLRWLTAPQTWAGAAPAAMLVFAHPGDETIGVGGRLDQLAGALLVCVTDGVPRYPQPVEPEASASRAGAVRARAAELDRVVELAGIPPDKVQRLGLVEGEAAWHMPTLVDQLVELIIAWRPEVILTHAYEGGHPDHDTTALATHCARALLTRERGPVPTLVEMAGYHSDGLGGRRSGCFLPDPACPIAQAPLSAAQQDRKRRLMLAYATRPVELPELSLAVERFRIAPAYDFQEPPHSGRLYYEHAGRGIAGWQWRGLARSTLEPLGLRGPI